MRGFRQTAVALALGLAVVGGAGVAVAQSFSWRTVVNNGDDIPPFPPSAESKKFNSYSQPSVNERGLVAFRGRSKGPKEPIRGVYARDMRTSAAVVPIAYVEGAVPQPNNVYYNGELASFNEFPAFPRIDASSPTIATRGQSLPVWEFQIGVDSEGAALTTRVGTAGVYANPGGVLAPGASLLGAATNWPSLALTFPQFSVPGAPTGTRFDQFPGSPSVSGGTMVAFKGNYTVDDVGHTGVYFRDMRSFRNPTIRVADTLTRIPNQPAGSNVAFGSTAPPSSAGSYMYFVGSDNEDDPTLSGIYRAKMKTTGSISLETLVGLGTRVPGEPAGTVFAKFGEGLSVDGSGNFIAFWATWGAESTVRTLYCPTDGNADLIEYCDATYPDGLDVDIPVHQGIFVYDSKRKLTRVVAKAGQDGLQDFLYWVFSGRPPGVGGSEDGEQEEPRWRSSAFAAVTLMGRGYGVAFKANQAGVDGIFLRKGPDVSPLVPVVKLFTNGQLIDAEAPAGSIVTAVGIEREGFRGNRLAITASMLYETVEESIGWAGIYVTEVR